MVYVIRTFVFRLLYDTQITNVTIRHERNSIDAIHSIQEKENKNRVGILFDALSFDTLYDFVISTLSGSNNINDNELLQPTKHLDFI